MYKNFYKIFLLTGLSFITTQYANASQSLNLENDPTIHQAAPVLTNMWSNRELVNHLGGVAVFSKCIEFNTSEKDFFIDSFIIEKVLDRFGELSNENCRLSINITCNLKAKNYEATKESINKEFEALQLTPKVSVGHYSEELDNKLVREKFLSVFYRRDLIPHFLIDFILKEFSIVDFRLTTEKLLKQIQENLGDDYTADAFRKYVFQELEGVRDPIRRGAIAWDVIKYLQKSENADNALLIDLCNQITETQSPVYENAIHLKTMLAFTKDTKKES